MNRDVNEGPKLAVLIPSIGIGIIVLYQGLAGEDNIVLVGTGTLVVTVSVALLIIHFARRDIRAATSPQQAWHAYQSTFKIRSRGLWKCFVIASLLSGAIAIAATVVMDKGVTYSKLIGVPVVFAWEVVYRADDGRMLIGSDIHQAHSYHRVASVKVSVAGRRRGWFVWTSSELGEVTKTISTFDGRQFTDVDIAELPSGDPVVQTFDEYVRRTGTPLQIAAWDDKLPATIHNWGQWWSLLSGTAYFVFTFMFPVICIVSTVRLARKDRRLKNGRCRECAYDLQHKFEGGCPECGWGRET